MKSEGISVVYHAKVTGISSESDGTIVVSYKNSAHETFYKKATCFLLAFSRDGNIKKLDLEAIGVKYNTNGIQVNEAMQTSVPHIFACGNAVGQLYTLNRVSYYQAQTAAQNATKYFWQKYVTVDYSHVTSYVHALRPLGSIGLTEQDAHKKYGKNIVVYRYTYNSLIKAHIEKTTDGIAKFICDSQGNLLGAHILGAAADNIIDNVRIGEHFAYQFKDYMLELRTSPNYLDVAWEASKQADTETARSIWSSVLGYIQQIF
jgi:pyruvate/2-oxoglutarate dehydrogenase complex dihydrolipoamide dehydrogenase (E3) component